MLSQLRTQIQARAIHTRLLNTTSLRGYSKPSSSDHTSDSYAKDVDATPPSDSQVHRVDPNSESVQKPHEPPSGEWSRAGVKTKEYENVDHAHPYAASGGQNQRYGGKESYPAEKGPETSQPGDGPEGKEAGGRKAEEGSSGKSH